MWPFKTKTEKRKIMHSKGYEWAAGLLLKGRTPSKIEQYLAIARTFDDYYAFEDGMKKAIQDFTKLEEKIKNEL